MPSISPLKILNSDGTPFLGGIELTEYTLVKTRMGMPSLTAKLMHPACLDKSWAGGEYVMCQGEKYIVRDVPNSSKSASDERYEHEISFVSEREVLGQVYFFDVASVPAGEDYKPITNSTKFSFYGTIREFVARLNCSMAYVGIGDSAILSATATDFKNGTIEPSGDGYLAVVDPNGGFPLDEVKEISFETKFLAEAISEAYSVWEVPFSFRGRKIVFGERESVVDRPFKYGHDRELMAVSKNSKGGQIVNEATAVGSSENIPYYYPNETEYGHIELECAESNEQITDNRALSCSNISRLISQTREGEPITFRYQAMLDAPAATRFMVSDPGFNEGYSERSVNTIVRIPQYDGWPSNVEIPFKVSFDIPAEGDYSFAMMGYFDTDVSGTHPDLSTRNFVADGRVRFENLWRPDNSIAKIVQPGLDSGNPGGKITLYADSPGRYTMSFLVRFPNTGVDLVVMSMEMRNVLEDRMYWEQDGKQFFGSTALGLKIEGIVLGPQYEGESVLWRGVGRMPFQDKLVVPKYRATAGAQRFYRAINSNYGAYASAYDNPSGGKYHFNHPYVEGMPSQMEYEHEEIKPTMEGLKNSHGQPFGELAGVAFDLWDNDSLKPGSDADSTTADYEHSFFYVKLHKLDYIDAASGNDYSLDLFAMASQRDPMTIQMTSGRCAGCKFKIQALSGTGDDTGKWFNPVQVDTDGNIVEGDYNDKVKKSIIQTRQQNTAENDVWVCVQKDTETFGVIMPNRTNLYLPSAGDTFNIINIDLPECYIRDAEKRLEKAMMADMKADNDERWVNDITISRIFAAQNPSVVEQIDEYSLIDVEYNGDTWRQYVNSVTYEVKEGEPLPEIKVDLDDEVSASSSFTKRAAIGAASLLEKSALWGRSNTTPTPFVTPNASKAPSRSESDATESESASSDGHSHPNLSLISRLLVDDEGFLSLSSSGGVVQRVRAGYAESAGSLSETRQIWGNDFDGSGDVTGDLMLGESRIDVGGAGWIWKDQSGAMSISASAKISISAATVDVSGATVKISATQQNNPACELELTADGNVSIDSHNGNILAKSDVKLDCGKKLYFSDDIHYIELTENGFHFSHGLYSDSFVTAFGVGASGGTGAGGLDVERMWEELAGRTGSTQIAVEHLHDALADYALAVDLDSYVDRYTEQSIGGIKTFTQQPTVKLSSVPRICYKAGDTFYGYIGCNAANVPTFWASAGTDPKTLLHEDNFGSYVTKSYVDGLGIAAAKLATARSLWGNAFDGTADINGTIDFGNASLSQSGSDLLLSANGKILADSDLRIASGKRLYFSDNSHYIEITNDGFHFSHGVYSDSFVSAFGTGTTASGGGLDTAALWAQLGPGNSNQIDPVHLSQFYTKSAVDGLLALYAPLTALEGYLPLAGGNLAGALTINLPSNVTNNYNDGIRCNLGGTGNWATLMLGGAPNSTSGTGQGVWGLFVHDKTFSIGHASSSNAAYGLNWNHTGELNFKTSALTNNGNPILGSDNFSTYVTQSYINGLSIDAATLGGTALGSLLSSVSLGTDGAVSVTVGGSTKTSSAASGTWGISVTGNAATATKLATSRSLWGNAFDGTADVTGAIKFASVEYINGTASLLTVGNATSGKSLTLTSGGTTTLSGVTTTISAGNNASISAVGDLSLSSTNSKILAKSHIKLSDGKRLYFKDDNHYIELTDDGFHFSHGIYSDSFVTAFGVGTSSGGGGGLDTVQMWQELAANNNNNQIHASHLSNAMSGYVQSSELTGYVNTSAAQDVGGVKTFTQQPTVKLSSAPRICYKAGDTFYGYIGCNAVNVPTFWASAGTDPKTLLHEGNFGSYVTKSYVDGLGINATQIGGLTSDKVFRKYNRTDVGASLNLDTTTLFGIIELRTTEITITNAPREGFGAFLNFGNGEHAFIQIAGVTGDLYYRSGQRANGGNGADKSAWAWAKFLDSSNYTNYAPTKTGSGASGTWGISITGNAASATYATTAGSAGHANTATNFDHMVSIWGQSFTGNSGISGDMTGVGSITMSDDLIMGGDLYMANTKSLRFADSGGTYREAMGYTNGNLLRIGYGQFASASSAYDTQINGKVLHLRSGANTESIKDTTIDENGWLNPYANICMKNNTAIYSKTSDGTTNAQMLKLSNGDLMMIGNTGYETNYYGGAEISFGGHHGKYGIRILTEQSGDSWISKVGIDKWTPECSLHVGGDTKIDGTLTVTGQGWFKEHVNIELNKGFKWSNALLIQGFMGSGGPSLTMGISTTAGIVTLQGIGISINAPLNGVSVSGNLSATGGITAMAVTSSSDIRLKENIRPLELSASQVAMLPAVEYDWRDGSGRDCGTIAQQMAAVLPLCVKANSDGMLTVDYGKAGLLSAIAVAKEHGNRIAELEARVSALEEENSYLRAQIAN